jgi:hypothetical protein
MYIFLFDGDAAGIQASLRGIDLVLERDAGEGHFRSLGVRTRFIPKSHSETVLRDF